MKPTLGNFLKDVFGPVFGRAVKPVRPQLIIPQLPAPLGLHDFLLLDVPPRGMLLNPILPERSLSMLYAPRGIGKSWVALSIGLAVASGGCFLRWAAPRPRRVLVCDGEMLLADLKGRLALLAALFGDIRPDGFRILAADSTETGIDLATAIGQRALDQYLDGVDLLILDNLSTLMGSGSEGASDAWLPIQNWLLSLRRRGIAVLIVHHAGVNGRQRGTSRREDALDTVIALRRPQDYSPEQGARFEVHIEKSRTTAGQGVKPFEASVEAFVTGSGKAGVRWTANDIEPPTLHRAAALFEAGMTVREVAAMLGISRSEAGRLRLRAIAGGLFEPDGDEEGEEPEPAVNGHLRPN